MHDSNHTADIPSQKKMQMNAGTWDNGNRLGMDNRRSGVENRKTDRDNNRNSY